MSIESYKSVIKRLMVQAGEPYAMGYDCAVNGANTTNCNFGIFSTKERTKEWERGKAAGNAAKRTAQLGERHE